jgi:hypothetical protein
VKAGYNVVSSMKSAWLILVLVSARSLYAADAAPIPLVATKFLALFQDLRDAEAQKAAGKVRHVSFRISSSEIDDYMRWSLKATPRPGLESVTVKIFPHNYVSTFTIVDFDAVEKWKPGTIPGILRPVLNGKKSIWVDYRFGDDNGKMTFSVEKAYYGGLRLPAFFVQEMIKIVAARQPEKYDTSKPLPLPFGLRRIWTEEQFVLGEN